MYVRVCVIIPGIPTIYVHNVLLYDTLGTWAHTQTYHTHIHIHPPLSDGLYAGRDRERPRPMEEDEEDQRCAG